VNWKERGIALTQKTSFPESERTELVIDKSPATPWTLHIRIPSWTTAANSIAVNGERLEVSGAPGSYLSLARAWKAGDRIELAIPMRITAEPLADDRTQQAFLYGPLVLAGQFPKTALDEVLEHNQGPEIQQAPSLQIPALKPYGPDPRAWIQPISGETLAFHTTGQEREVILKPLNQTWQRSAVYWKVS
jgi:DUF1680 family protein